MIEKDVDAPIVEKTDYSDTGIRDLSKRTSNKELLFEYPTVYLIYRKDNQDKYEVYVGETNDICQRTWQHLHEDTHTRDDWNALKRAGDVSMIVIGHDRFNKSLTLDIENKMMLYMSGISDVKDLDNRRGNAQNKYFTADIRDAVFSKIWRKLRKINSDLFPLERIIQDSAIFKASPFHKLTDQQNKAKDLILKKISISLHCSRKNQLILVEGEAGSGKTVLLSTIFYLIYQYSHDKIFSEFRDTKNYLLVNHDEQLKVYEDIVEKLGISNGKDHIVSKPTTFINHHSPENKVDIVLIDEAHLLWTQGKQAYRGKNQLSDIMKRARVTIAVFDPKQVLKTEEYLEINQITNLEEMAVEDNSFIKLKDQLRINADQKTIDWIKAITDQRKIKEWDGDSRNYDLQVFDDPEEMYQKIKERNDDRENSGLSRVVATFDWEYNQKKKPNNGNYWMVTVGNFKLPWNLQLPIDSQQKKLKNHLAWAEQNQTIDEVGSTYTIQGFDLNYAGVIIGPSVRYVDDRVVFDKKYSKNTNAIRQRTLSNGKQKYVSNELLANELNVLLTRGVNGLYIYAVDDRLREKLKQSVKRRVL